MPNRVFFFFLEMWFFIYIKDSVLRALRLRPELTLILSFFPWLGKIVEFGTNNQNQELPAKKMKRWCILMLANLKSRDEKKFSRSRLPCAICQVARTWPSALLLLSSNGWAGWKPSQSHRRTSKSVWGASSADSRTTASPMWRPKVPSSWIYEASWSSYPAWKSISAYNWKQIQQKLPRWIFFPARDNQLLI